MTETHALLRELQWLYPGAHPHTLACLMMSEFGIEMNGRKARLLLEQQKSPQVGADALADDDQPSGAGSGAGS